MVMRQNRQCRLLALGADLQNVWEASTTTARDRKELLRTLLEEVIVTVFKAQHRARLDKKMAELPSTVSPSIMLRPTN